MSTTSPVTLTRADEDIFDRVTNEAIREVIQRAHDRLEEDRIAYVLLGFLVRVASTWRSVAVLWRECPETFAVDAAALLRAMLDAYLQAEYVVHDPEKAAGRATLYLEYEHVERQRAIRKLMEHDTSRETPEGIATP